MGTIAKDTSVGPFIEEWKKAFEDISKDVEEVDITPALSAAALAVKDENELVGLAALLWITELPLMKSAFDAQCLEGLYRAHGGVLRRGNVQGSRCGEGCDS